MPTVGDWINGTYLNAKLVSATPRADPDGNITDYAFEFAYPQGATSFRIFPPKGQSVWLDITDGRANATVSFRGPATVQINILGHDEVAPYVWSGP
jgi:hypothetical protein